ncbi:rhodanese-like domain-containing protein [Arthrobacter sp. EPSL27]|uniref:rhodanese-like domain-containing protein n=1 Tax=Arthrobacter sp. EPSL27 TaxID=1745378 RepID=UPI00074AA8AA|nr:rhodanese-like domain-containing protein [Arthrobacter sp. EPSL27]KUM33222.1 sulfurtransferase [Arthrobacter sp. EPSL27]
MRTITTDDLAAKWPRAALVDVRGADEYATVHIPGSISIPLDELPGRLKDVPNSTTVYVLCGSGKRSTQAGALLAGRGYDVVNVAGGITEWYRGGHPVNYAPPPADAPARGRWRSLADRLRGRRTGSP